MRLNPLLGRRKKLLALTVAAASLGVIAFGLVGGATASDTPTRPIKVNQTDGYGDGEVVVFTYFQNFHCTTEPFVDLDGPNHRGDGKVAAVDPEEFQTPPCILGDSGSGSLPLVDPAGDPISGTEPLFVIVPFFDANGDGTPEAVAAHPAVDVQCPEPGPPLSQHKGDFGTCTMHPTTLHAEPAGLSDIPLVNHSHIIDGKNFGAIWWQVIAVLVTDRTVWPDVNGRCPADPSGNSGKCLTSVNSLRNAQKAGKASGDVPSNFFLFFDSRELGH